MTKDRRSANFMSVALLLAMFAIMAISVAFMGAEVYTHAAHRMKANFETRTSLVYVTEKIRQCAGEDLEIGKVGGSPALILKERLGGARADSWIFVADGQLREAVLAAGVQAGKGDGNAIMALDSMKFDARGPLLTITAKDPSGRRNSITLFRRELS